MFLRSVYFVTQDRWKQSSTLRGGWMTMRLALLIAGIIAVLTGIVWIGQGTGYFPYPSSSFMIDQRKWAYAGVALVVLGLLLIAGRRGV